MIDQLRQLAIFAKTIDHGSFRGAARELRLSPSVVSHHISQLEEHLGAALIYRTTRKLTLTREGERLLAATRRMIDAIEGELIAVSTGASEPSGELRITAPSVLSKSRFTDRIAAFLTDYPRVGLSLDFSDERKELVGDGYDIAIRMSIRGKRPGGSHPLFHTRRKLVAAPDYLARWPSPHDPADLKDWVWLELAPVRNIPTRFRKSGEEQVIHLKSAQCRCNDAQGLYRLARAGAGLAMVPEFLAAEDVASGRIAYVLPEWELDPLEVFATWPSNAPKNGLIALLVGELGKDGAGL